MAHLYRFSIIQARPDVMRGERVNIGLVALGPNGLDIRLPEIRKLRPLTGHSWDDVASAFTHTVSKAYSSNVFDLISTGTESFSLGGSEVFILGKPGQIRVNSINEYESAIRNILSSFVNMPLLSRKEKQQKINTEISAMLKTGGVLAEKGQTIEDGKVISKFVVSEEKEIVADFAYKANGLKIVSTLELRGLLSGAHSKACEKGATLFFAKKHFGSAIKPLGVYAVDPAQAENFHSEIEILTSFADGNVYNWLDANDRMKFKQALY